MKKRSRSSEGVIPLEYLIDLHNKHEEWLMNLPKDKVLVLDGNKDFESNEDIFNDYADKIKHFLKRSRSRSKKNSITSNWSHFYASYAKPFMNNENENHEKDEF